MTPQQRDRDARAVAAIARGCGFDQPVAPLILRRVPDVDKLLRADEATRRRVVGDPELRRTLREGLVAGFEPTWKQATLERIRGGDPVMWLRGWWLPVLPADELDRLLRSPTPRPDHRRVAIAVPAFRTTVGAAQVLVDQSHRGQIAGHLAVERRFATTILDLAHEVARADRIDPSGPPLATADLDRAPDGVDPREHPHVAWWHGR